MSTQSIEVREASTSTPAAGTWGTRCHFQRLTGVDDLTAVYWVRVVHRPAHRVGHPVPMAGCPGCAFERAVV